MLGIAADDIFVFIDAWRQSEYVDEEVMKGDKKRRLAYAFRRAVRAMAVTSSTTSVAFFANVFSPLMPIKAFGAFAGFIIPINYFLVVMIFPPATIFYEKYLENMCQKCCKKKEETGAKPKSKVEEFFGGPWNDYVKEYRFYIVSLFTMWSIAAAAIAFQIGPLTEAEKFIDDDHPAMASSLTLQNDFTTGKDGYTTVSFIMGIEGLDKSEVSMWNPRDSGKAVMDPKFNPNSKASQEFLLTVCDDLNAEGVYVKGTVSCWFTDFTKWLDETKSVSLPVSEEQFESVLYEWTEATIEGKTSK